MYLFQLRECIEDAIAFPDFKEGYLGFPPSYKFNKKTDVYDTRWV